MQNSWYRTVKPAHWSHTIYHGRLSCSLYHIVVHIPLSQSGFRQRRLRRWSLWHPNIRLSQCTDSHGSLFKYLPLTTILFAEQWVERDLYFGSPTQHNIFIYLLHMSNLWNWTVLLYSLLEFTCETPILKVASVKCLSYVWKCSSSNI